MPKQLTIFDVEPVVSFDPKKAHIQRLNSKLQYADVVVQIPRQAKAIDELKPTIAPDERYELFEYHVIGIVANERRINNLYGNKRKKRYVNEQGIVKSRLQYDFIYPWNNHFFWRMLCNIYRQIKKAEITLNLLRQGNYNIFGSGFDGDYQRKYCRNED